MPSCIKKLPTTLHANGNDAQTPTHENFLKFYYETYGQQYVETYATQIKQYADYIDNYNATTAHNSAYQQQYANQLIQSPQTGGLVYETPNNSLYYENFSNQTNINPSNYYTLQQGYYPNLYYDTPYYNSLYYQSYLAKGINLSFVL